MKLNKIIFSAIALSVLAISSTAQAAPLQPTASTSARCEHNWGADNRLSVQCANLYDACKAGKLKHKGCKAFVRRWDRYSSQFH
ncbi:hypothetical protein [Moraxella sp.]|uniref:hypothetical protein n=1 Tax=Moraxella sp. TaxID=479 RepID=UPI0026DD99DE|nr:hypothetical protein [Moraxella sp.]MDO4895524.1 hypothetical protein [Moraxella sp.]